MESKKIVFIKKNRCFYIPASIVALIQNRINYVNEGTAPITTVRRGLTSSTTIAKLLKNKQLFFQDFERSQEGDKALFKAFFCLLYSSAAKSAKLEELYDSLHRI